MRGIAGFDDAKPSRELASVVRFAGLVLNFDACLLARESGDPIPLTRGEFAVLRMFVTRPGRVISRDTLLDAFTDRRFEPFDRSIDVLVGRLRKKVEADPKQPRLIVTVAGEGYRFDGLRLTSPQIAKLADADGTAKREGMPTAARASEGRGRSWKARRVRRNGAISQRSPPNLYGPRRLTRTIRRTCASSSTHSAG